MKLDLDEQEIRILGCLFEKQLATPEYYPLSLNALTNACNQKSNRHPVVDYDEATVIEALEGLMVKKLVHRSMVGRVPKYEELFIRGHNMVPREAALLCVLLLRGPQTLGELRGRTARMVTFDSVEAVHEVMGHLVEWGMSQQLPRLPGHKESRYGHLLAVDARPDPVAPVTTVVPATSAAPAEIDGTSRLAALETEVAVLRQTLDTLRQEFEAFKKLFA